MPLPVDYIERVYAGVLGKIIGVYLGRPFEGWSYEHIMERLGEITYYVHEQLNSPLIVTDDDISGTFTFLRALPDYGNRSDLSASQIGQTWLNYIIEDRTVLWWGGMGNSTEHTAFLRLKHGIPAPRSGSMALNGKVVAEQIGAQIFIDGWGLISPGDPERAADLARRAASVSHDGEAIYGAQVIAAMEAQAFVESDLATLFDVSGSFIPHDSLIYRLIQDIREWRTVDGDWRKTRDRIVERYGYASYGGGCHMIPNHALIILALVYGDDDFQRSLMIANTSGWDTDCNSGNVGCILGVKNGLASIDAKADWRGPVADRLYLPTADGGRAISDAVAETYHIVNIGRALVGESPVYPKGGARFHFELPGSVQGFQVDQSSLATEPNSHVRLENVVGHSREGEHSLALHYHVLEQQPVRVATATFTPPEALSMPNYGLVASPTLYPGQTVHAVVSADENNASPVVCRPYISHYGKDDQLVLVYGSETHLLSGDDYELSWTIPATGSQPIAQVGLEISAAHETSGTVYLDYLTWDGTPDLVLARPEVEGTAWKQAWVSAMDLIHDRFFFRLVQNEGRGLLIHGTREWQNYRVSASFTPHLAKTVGLAVRVQGLQRYYALLLCSDGYVRLVRELDGEHVLAEQRLDWQLDQSYLLTVEVKGQRLVAWIDQHQVFDVTDDELALNGGGIALISEEGRVDVGSVTVTRTQL